MVKKKLKNGKWKVKGVRGTWLKKSFSTKKAAESKERTVGRMKQRVRHTRRK